MKRKILLMQINLNICSKIVTYLLEKNILLEIEHVLQKDLESRDTLPTLRRKYDMHI